MQKIGWKTATALVIANMIGAGVFTSLGIQLEYVHSPVLILLLWALGGVMALTGAWSYAALGTIFKRSGGEYHFLSQLFHPILGYLSGWVSITVGFSASIALAAMSVAEYLGPIGLSYGNWLAAGIVLLFAVVHSFSIKNSSLFQQGITWLKVLAIICFIICGLWCTKDLQWQNLRVTDMDGSGSLGVAFAFVCFAYSGWNAAAYISDEIKNLRTNLPKALLIGTIVVCFLYLLLHLVFFLTTDLAVLNGQIDVGKIVANNIWGPNGASWMSFIIIIILLSSLSGMLWVGSRVTQVIGEDFQIWRRYAKLNSNQVPVRAIWLQALISIGFIFSGSFEQVLIYSSFIIQLFSLLAVIGLVRYRWREHKNSDTFRSPYFPIPQFIFILINLWVLVYLLVDKPRESSLGLISVVLALLTYYINQRLFKPSNKET